MRRTEEIIDEDLYNAQHPNQDQQMFQRSNYGSAQQQHHQLYVANQMDSNQQQQQNQRNKYGHGSNEYDSGAVYGSQEAITHQAGGPMAGPIKLAQRPSSASVVASNPPQQQAAEPGVANTKSKLTLIHFCKYRTKCQEHEKKQPFYLTFKKENSDFVTARFCNILN